MFMALCLAASVCILAQPTKPIVLGEVVFVDETGLEERVMYATRRLEVEFLSDYGTDTQSVCTSKARVRDDGTFEVGISPDCVDQDLALQARWRPDTLDWRQESLPLMLVHIPDQESYRVKIRIVRPLQVAPEQRRRFANLAQASFSEGQLDDAVLLWTEASRGNNLSYAVEAANFFEENQYQAGAWPVLESLDIPSLELSEQKQFQLWTRTGHAARAAELPDVALENYAKALKTYPTNREVLSIAYTTFVDALGVASSRDVLGAVKEQEDTKLVESMKDVYIAYSGDEDAEHFIEPRAPGLQPGIVSLQADLKTVDGTNVNRFPKSHNGF